MRWPDAPWGRFSNLPVPVARARRKTATPHRMDFQWLRTDDASVSIGTIDPFDALERLAALHARGIVDAEYRAKKAELLARI